MEKIPTAEEFLDPSDSMMDNEDVKIAMIAFAKYHVEAALKAAVDNVTLLVDEEETGSKQYVHHYDYTHVDINEQSILTVYPLNNIV